MSGTIDRLGDELPVNPPYDGVVAEAYDLWLSPGTAMPDDAVLAEVVREAAGPALELGCGNGRFLVPLVEEGLPIEGVDASADMLAVCRSHLVARGLDASLYEGSMAPLELRRRYAAVVCPAGSFSLIEDASRATRAIESYVDHLEPDGRLAITFYVPRHDFDARFEWRLRRSATRPSDGTTFVVHEAVACDRQEQVEIAYNRHEVWDAEGRLVHTELRKHRLRWWERPAAEELLRAAGLDDVSSDGEGDLWVTLGRLTSGRGGRRPSGG